MCVFLATQLSSSVTLNDCIEHVCVNAHFGAWCWDTHAERALHLFKSCTHTRDLSNEEPNTGLPFFMRNPSYFSWHNHHRILKMYQCFGISHIWIHTCARCLWKKRLNHLAKREIYGAPIFKYGTLVLLTSIHSINNTTNIWSCSQMWWWRSLITC